MFSALAIQAQVHNVFTDVSIPGISPFGISETYNYKARKHYGIGAGLQVVKRHPITHKAKFIPSLFVDMRFYLRPERKHQFFAMIDLGASIFKSGEEYDRTVWKSYDYSGGSLFAGWGFEYLYTVTKNGSGPYAALKLLSNIGHGSYYYTIGGLFTFDAVPALCVGYKF